MPTARNFAMADQLAGLFKPQTPKNSDKKQQANPSGRKVFIAQQPAAPPVKPFTGNTGKPPLEPNPFSKRKHIWCGEPTGTMLDGDALNDFITQAADEAAHAPAEIEELIETPAEPQEPDPEEELESEPETEPEIEEEPKP